MTTASRNFIPIIKPWIGEEEIEAVKRPLSSGWLTQGPEVAAFEKEFAEYVGASHACAVSNGTAALHVALLAVGVCPGSEVITVSHSYIATANSVRYCGATPVFVDIQPDTFNMDPARIEAAITPKTRAILCVHQMGMPCDLKAILEIAQRHSLAVVEDAACAVGSEILWNGQWEKVGKPHGDIATFSFHPRKLIAVGDGGMLVTANPDWDREFRARREHGMTLSGTVRHGLKQVVFEDYTILGYNYRLTDMQAAVGREQLKRLPALLERRRAQAKRYGELLGDVPGLKLPVQPEWALSNWQCYCARLPSGSNQKAVMQFMLDRGIATRRGIMCAHREPAYADWPRPHTLIESERAQDECILLPLFHQMTDEEQQYVAETLKRALACC